ncbi:MAG: terminase small subunit [Smithella sp.]
MHKVTPQQEKFCQNVAAGKSQAESYRIAYPKSKKWKDEAVWVNSSRIMNEANVLLRIDELREKHLKRNEVTLDEVIKEMAKWLRFNLKSIIKADGTMKSFEEMTEDEAACIAEFQIEEIWEGRGENREMIGYLKKVKLIDKRAVSDQFMKKFGAYATKLKFDDDDLEHLKDLVKEIKG